MFCPNCGKPVKEQDRYCPSCGEILPWVSFSYTDLVQRAMAGDQGAYSELYAKSFGKVNMVLKMQQIPESEMEDLAQETYCKIFSSLAQLSDPEKFLAWVGVIARTTAIDYQKVHKNHIVQDALLPEKPDKKDQDDITEPTIEQLPDTMNPYVNPEKVLDRVESRKLLGEILSALPEEQEQVICLFYFEEMKVAEIAAMLQISENTVKSRLNYGRKKMNSQVKAMEKRGVSLLGLAPVAFVVFLYRSMDVQAAAVPADMGLFQRVAGSLEHRTAAAGTQTSEKPSGQHTGGSAETETAGNAAKKAASAASKSASSAGKAILASKTGVKLAALITAGAVATGSGIAIARHAGKDDTQIAEGEDTQTTEEEDTQTAGTADTQDATSNAQEPSSGYDLALTAKQDLEKEENYDEIVQILNDKTFQSYMKDNGEIGTEQYTQQTQYCVEIDGTVLSYSEIDKGYTAYYLDDGNIWVMTLEGEGDCIGCTGIVPAMEADDDIMKDGSLQEIVYGG